MEYAHPQNEEVSAVGSLNLTIALNCVGRYPRPASVRGQVLADLLSGKVISALDAVYGSSTTRLAPAILILKQYGWSINSDEQAVGTLDGRVAYVAFYSMRTSNRLSAINSGADAWIDEVRIARANKRKLAEQCKIKAAKWNKKCTVDPRQNNLWCAA